MSSKQSKLTELISLAVENGWDRRNEATTFNPNVGLYGMLFSHDFAKAIWGDFKSGEIGNFDELENWKYHLQQAVISKDPLKYYWENK